MEPHILVFDDGERVRVSPPMFSNNTIKEQPGDLTKFANHGNGVYGYQKGIGWNPFTCAPPQDAHGGVIYFDNNITRNDFDALLRIMGLKSCNPKKQYSVFMEESKQPGQDGYLKQIRLVPRFAMKHLFGTISEDEYENFPEQNFSMADCMWKFMQSEKKRWGTSCFEDQKKGLAGLFGGDGDFAREALSFGFMLENDYHTVCRIWSRAWLVTK